MRQVIAIIGGGFCGTMVAVHLLRQKEKPVEVILINDGYPVGKGVAYSAYSDVFLLNVHAARMSAFPDQPLHFVEWLLQRPEYVGVPPETIATSFVPRKHYGDYLAQLLEEALQETSTQNTTRLLQGRVVQAIHSPTQALPFRLVLQDGQEVEAQQVVLALGNFLPSPLPCLAKAAPLQPPLYYANPWKPQAWQNLPANASLVLIGTGLTSIDIILDLLSQNFKGTVTAVSTNGFLPYPYQTSSVDLEFSQSLTQASTLGQAIDLFKGALRKHGPAHWEHIINGARAQTLGLWQRFSAQDKRRFQRWLGSLWAVARHRLPPQVHKKIQDAVESGFLRIVSGRIETITPARESSLEVTVLTEKGPETLAAHRVINCTGPQLNYAALPDPLVKSLLQQQLVSPHPMGMGVRAEGYHVLGADGPTPGLFTLGASLRGKLWESNAVPELRTQAQELARALLSNL